MRSNKIKSYLGFSVKSGNVIFGSDKLFESKKKYRTIHDFRFNIINTLNTYRYFNRTDVRQF